MIVGTNYANSGGKTYFGFSSSYTSSLTQHFTRVSIHDLPKRETDEKNRKTKDEKEQIITELRANIMAKNIQEALKKHQEMNKGALPEQIIVYRDGIGGPTFAEKCKKTEVEQVVQAVNAYQQNYRPRILYVFVDRNISHRLFYKDNGSFINPGPGTALDMGLVENQGDKFFDFYLIPHKATVATA